MSIKQYVSLLLIAVLLFTAAVSCNKPAELAGGVLLGNRSNNRSAASAKRHRDKAATSEHI